jgi:hypothetical protein
MKTHTIAILIILIFNFTGCNTVTRRIETREPPDTYNSFAEFKKNKDGKEWLELTSPLVDPAVFRGSFKLQDNGDIEFDISLFSQISMAKKHFRRNI